MRYVWLGLAIAVALFTLLVYLVARDFHVGGYVAGAFVAYIQNLQWGKG